MIIFANILLDKGVITNQTFTSLLLMAVGSTMLDGAARGTEAAKDEEHRHALRLKGATEHGVVPD